MKECINCGSKFNEEQIVSGTDLCKNCYNQECSAEEEKFVKNDLEEALKSFKQRLGVTFNELCISKNAQIKARRVLDEETERLRRKFLRNI